MVNICVYVYVCVYIHICVCVCLCVCVCIAAVIVDVGTVNGQMLWWLVWLANRVNDTIKTRVDAGEITYCYLSLCIGALYRNPVMYAEPQRGGCRSARKLLVELVGYKKRVYCVLRLGLYFRNSLPYPTFYLRFATHVFVLCVCRVSAAGLRSYLNRETKFIGNSTQENFLRNS